MLIDLVAAMPEESNLLLTTQGHAGVWPTLEANTVDQVKLSSLALILQGREVNDTSVVEYLKEFKNLESASEDGPWIDLLPDRLIADLAGLKEEGIDPVARMWSNTPEAKLDRWNPGDVAPFLKELSAFSASALSQGSKVLLWVCL